MQNLKIYKFMIGLLRPIRISSGNTTDTEINVSYFKIGILFFFLFLFYCAFRKVFPTPLKLRMHIRPSIQILYFKFSILIFESLFSVRKIAAPFEIQILAVSKIKSFIFKSNVHFSFLLQWTR